MRFSPVPAPLRRFTETPTYKKEDAVTASSFLFFYFPCCSPRAICISSLREETPSLL